jgi:hydroxymethylglutaryl-CoA lyase
MRYPSRIFIREVSPRDGLQSEPVHLSTEDKIALIDLVSSAGFPQVNAVSFVSPRAVPQMADAVEVATGIKRRPGTIYDATVPNATGARRAIDTKMDSIVVFVSASEGANRTNVHRSTEEALTEAEAAIREARAGGLQAVGLVATAFGSAYEGVIPVEKIVRIAQRLVDAGATELALGDTSGEATPRQVNRMIGTMLDKFPEYELALHFHDTRGLALANVLSAMDAGATRFDSAVGGIGGSPFTPNSMGNVSTEDLIHMCEEAGVETGVDLEIVLEAYHFLQDRLQHPLPGRLGRFGRSKKVTVQ